MKDLLLVGYIMYKIEEQMKDLLIIGGYIMYKIEERIKLLTYKIKRPKEEKKMMKKYINQIRRI